MSEQETRTPPEKIRVTKLQEAHLRDLERIEQEVAAMYQANLGLSSEQHAPLNELTIAVLTKTHDVLVAEADDKVAGYLAWADQAPGVAYIARLMVAEEYRRFGVGTRLLREVGESAGGHNIEVCAAMCWQKATWAMSFLGVRGFRPTQLGDVPSKLAHWCEALGTKNPEATNEKVCWWAPVDGLGNVPGLPRP